MQTIVKSLPLSPWWDSISPAVSEQLQLDDAATIEGQKFDLAIIGAGIAGLAAAAAAARVGIKTVVYERMHKIGGGATGRNAGILSSGINTPLASLPKESDGAVMWGETVDVARELVALAKEPQTILEAKQTGALSLARTDSGAKRLAKERSVLNERGFAAEILSPSEIRALTADYLNLDGVRCAMLLPNDGRIQPLTLLAHMAATARSHGAKLVHGAAALRATGAASLTEGVEPAADAIIVAVGPTNQPNSRIYAMAFDIELPENFPLFWDANPYVYYDYRPGNGRLVTSGGRYAKAGADSKDAAYHRRMLEASRSWMPALESVEPVYKWAVDLDVNPELIPCIQEVSPRVLSIEGLGSLGVLPGIVLARRAVKKLF